MFLIFCKLSSKQLSFIKVLLLFITEYFVKIRKTCLKTRVTTRSSSIKSTHKPFIHKILLLLSINIKNIFQRFKPQFFFLIKLKKKKNYQRTQSKLYVLFFNRFVKIVFNIPTLFIRGKECSFTSSRKEKDEHL